MCVCVLTFACMCYVRSCVHVCVAYVVVCTCVSTPRALIHKYHFSGIIQHT